MTGWGHGELTDDDATWHIDQTVTRVTPGRVVPDGRWSACCGWRLGGLAGCEWKSDVLVGPGGWQAWSRLFMASHTVLAHCLEL